MARKKRKLPKVITRREAEKLLHIVECDYGLRDRVALEFMYRAGLRVSEVVALVPRQVSLDGTIDIFDAKGGDGTAYFDAERVAPLLRRWLKLREIWVGEAPELPLFCKEDGSPMTSRYYQRVLAYAKEEAGIGGQCTPHVLRHSYATELLEDGFSLVEVQEALRHANLATTQVYLHVRDKALQSKMSKRSSRGGD